MLGLALAADAAAVCAAVGASSGRSRDVVRLAMAFGVAQGGMAALGAGAGVMLGGWFAAVDHWVAAAVLVALGITALRADPAKPPPPVGWGAMAGLSLATSTDALAAGVALPTLGLGIPVSAAVIGVVTAFACLAAGLAGARLGARFGRHATAGAGVALIALAGWIVARP